MLWKQSTLLDTKINVSFVNHFLQLCKYFWYTWHQKINHCIQNRLFLDKPKKRNNSSKCFIYLAINGQIKPTGRSKWKRSLCLKELEEIFKKRFPQLNVSRNTWCSADTQVEAVHSGLEQEKSGTCVPFHTLSYTHLKSLFLDVHCNQGSPVESSAECLDFLSTGFWVCQHFQ